MSEAALPAAASAAVRPPFRLRFGAGLRARGDDFRLALAALNGHKLRAGLTLLGIVIGVFTVISMMSLLRGLQASMDKTLGALGADVFEIQKFPAVNFGPMSPEVMKRKNIHLRDVLALREALPEAKQVGGEEWEGGKEVIAGDRTSHGVQVVGATPEYFANNNMSIGRGRGFDEGEALGAAHFVVLGAAVTDVLFPGRNPIGEKVRIGRMELEVLGALDRVGGMPLGDDPDNTAVVPITLFTELYGSGRSVDITIMARSHGDFAKLQDKAIAAFRRVRGLDAQAENDFEIFSNDSIRGTFDQLALAITLVSVFICALSLLVGGLGVMNIMLVAVTERTREIGLRKALGARRSRILVQFVVEAVLLASLGGVLGVVLGYAATGIARYLDFPAQVPVWAVVVSLVVSCGIGLLAGIYPAARASRLDPAVALRDE